MYVLQYKFPPTTHGSDLLALSWHEGVDIADLIKSFIKSVPDTITAVIQSTIISFATRYQPYFAAHALDGDPNGLKTPHSVTWEIFNDDGTTINNALKAGLLSTGRSPFFSIGPDYRSATTNCDF